VGSVEHRENVLAEAGLALELEEQIERRNADELRIAQQLVAENPGVARLVHRLMAELLEDRRCELLVDEALGGIQREELSEAS